MGLTKLNHTQISNDFLDKYMMIISGNSVKVFLSIARKTIGWHKETDNISLSQIVKITGMSTKTVIKCIAELENKDVIKVKRATKNKKKQTNNYEINYSIIVSTVNNTVGVLNNLQYPSVNITLPSSVNNTHTKESKDTITKEKRIEPIGSACNQDNNQTKKEPAFQTQFRAIWDRLYFEIFGIYYLATYGAENKNLLKIKNEPLDKMEGIIKAYLLSESFLLKDNKTILNFISNYNHEDLRAARIGNIGGGGIGARTDEEAKNDMDYLDSLHDRFIAGSETL